ncbi:MAG: Ribonuclease J 2 [Candidatus Izimaplasma bacterium HR2]|nr:MAG: Ribonuclease J 2 [Candidatus Izimaplasma bacterium HR2]
MSKIKFFALGGLGENGKNMYCLDINNKIFILDAGLKYPSHELFGVDSIVPDFDYLEENVDRIVGIFLSHGHEDHIGAVPKLLKTVKVPIYASYFTLALLKDLITDQGLNVNDYKFNQVTCDKTEKFGNIGVDFYRVTHSIPESLGIAISTPDGVIVYAPDFTFDQNVSGVYKTDFLKLSSIAGKKILALLVESLGAERVGKTHSSDALEYALNQAFYKAEDRIIVSAFSTDLMRIQKIIDISLKYDKNIVIIGRKTQRTVDIAVNLGYLQIPKDKLTNLRFIDDKNKNELKNSVILVSGDRHEPFYMLQRMVKKLDRLIHIRKSDSIILMTPPVPGTEKIAARTLDILYRFDTNVIKIDKNILPPAHASSEEIKLLINILQPEYIIPVVGEYRHQYALKKLCYQLGYAEDKVFSLDNGDVVEFEKGVGIKTKNKITSGDILVDGILDGDLSNVVLRDRELLSEDGVLLIIANVDARRKEIVTSPEVVSRGFAYMKENEEMVEEIELIFTKVSEKMFAGKYIDWRIYNKALKDEISKFLYRKTKRRPIIIPVIIDTQV